MIYLQHLHRHHYRKLRSDADPSLINDSLVNWSFVTLRVDCGSLCPRKLNSSLYQISRAFGFWKNLQLLLRLKDKTSRALKEFAIVGVERWRIKHHELLKEFAIVEVERWRIKHHELLKEFAVVEVEFLRIKHHELLKEFVIVEAKGVHEVNFYTKHFEILHI